jgi:CheY-like chemotaxis protein
MAPMNGLDFVHKLRRHPVADIRNTPVLMMSADRSTQTLNESASLGIVGYIVKPPQLVELRSKLERAFKFTSEV